jgi:glycosyltransferase involved in cell wall biosynthesis
MKILHLVTSLDFGGLERRMEILSKYPSSQNEFVFCALGGGGEAYNKMCSFDAQVHLLDCDFRIFSFKTFIKLLKFVKRAGVDVIHSHGAEANFYGMLVGFFLGVRVRVAEEIGIPAYSWKSRKIFSFIFGLAHSLVAMSPAVKRFLSKEMVLSEKKIDLVYNPVLLSERHKSSYLSSGVVVFAFLGRLEKVKNPDGLLRAFNELIKSGKKARLIFIGDGSLAESLKKYASDNALGEHVTFHGFSSDPFSILINADVIVQPSHNEGFSLALVEAMSAGLPALATPAGGAKALLINGGGWVMKSSEDNDLYAGLDAVLNNQKSIKEEGQKAIEAIGEKHDAKLYAKKLDSYYHGLISSKGSKRL